MASQKEQHGRTPMDEKQRQSGSDNLKDQQKTDKQKHDIDQDRNQSTDRKSGRQE
jgi:hypothetical protein